MEIYLLFSSILTVPTLYPLLSVIELIPFDSVHHYSGP